MKLAGRFEAKKHAYRQTQDGIVISFTVHPNDMQADLAAVPLGTILEIEYREPGEEPETPVAELVKPKPAKERRPWDTMTRAQQAGIRCAEPQFQRWLADYWPTAWEAAHQANPDVEDPEEIAAVTVRAMCGVESRKRLAEVEPGHLWEMVESNYRAATGQTAETRG